MTGFTYLLAEEIKFKGLPKVSADGNELQTILRVVFGIVGALAFLFIVISGFRYVISAGDPQEIAKAKNGIIYSLIGLVVSISAQIIVTWIVGNV
jgi:hypothetical protein